MSDEIKAINLAELRNDIKAELKADLKAEEEAKRLREEEKKEYAKAVLAEAEKQHQEELEAKDTEIKKLVERKSAPAFQQRVGKQSKSAGADEFLHWMKTGDNGNKRVLKPTEWEEDDGQKALQIGSDTEGGYLVPEDFYTTIVEKRDQMAWTRNVGINVIQTSLTNVQVPTEATSMTKFAITAEEGSYSDSDPIFGEVDITVYKFTRMNKFSEELLADQAANLEQFYSNAVARSMALTESYYVAVGTGSGQPQGVFVGGTAGLTFDSSGNITADEIPELFYKLGNGYRANSVWLADDETEAYLRGVRDSNNWAFDYMRPENIGVRGDWKYSTFYGGRPIFTETGVSTIATGNKVLLIGDFGFYGLVEREGLSVSRNPYLYEANGQVAFFNKFRMGGAVLQAEAFQYGTMA